MQSKKMSLIETIINVSVGYVIAVASQLIIFPFFDIHITFSENLLMGLFFTCVSIIRGYCIRRFFNKILVDKFKKV